MGRKVIHFASASDCLDNLAENSVAIMHSKAMMRRVILQYDKQLCYAYPDTFVEDIIQRKH